MPSTGDGNLYEEEEKCQLPCHADFAGAARGENWPALAGGGNTRSRYPIESKTQTGGVPTGPHSITSFTYPRSHAYGDCLLDADTLWTWRQVYSIVVSL